MLAATQTTNGKPSFIDVMDSFIAEYNKSHPETREEKKDRARRDRQWAKGKAFVTECEETATQLYSHLAKTLSEEQYDLLAHYSLLTAVSRYDVTDKGQGIFKRSLNQAKRLLKSNKGKR